jgi:hypothetical protein
MDSIRMKRVPHRPDLAVSDFFLFGDLKRQLSGCAFDHVDDLLSSVQEILDGFDKPMLIRVFQEWVRRLEQCIEKEGEYVG